MESSKDFGKKEARVIQVNEGELKKHVSEIVRESVEYTLNGLLEAEADQLCQARCYERNADRASTRAGHYTRSLQTTAGKMTLKVSKLRNLLFETAIIERYRRRESSVEEALVEMYLAVVSVRRVEDITEALWGSRVSSSTISELNKRFTRTSKRMEKQSFGEHVSLYMFVDGIWLKRSWGGVVQSVLVVVAIGGNKEGYREILGVAEGSREDAESWRNFFHCLKRRGLQRVRQEHRNTGRHRRFFPESRWQRCVVHFYRNVLNAVPAGKSKAVSTMQKAIHAQEDRDSAQQKAKQVSAKLKALRLDKAARIVQTGAEETFAFYEFLSNHWRYICTNNPLEQLNREIRRRTRVVENFPDGHSALMLVAVRLRYFAGKKWGTKRYINMKTFGKLS